MGNHGASGPEGTQPQKDYRAVGKLGEHKEHIIGGDEDEDTSPGAQAREAKKKVELAAMNLNTFQDLGIDPNEKREQVAYPFSRAGKLVDVAMDLMTPQIAAVVKRLDPNTKIGDTYYFDPVAVKESLAVVLAQSGIDPNKMVKPGQFLVIVGSEEDATIKLRGDKEKPSGINRRSGRKGNKSRGRHRRA